MGVMSRRVVPACGKLCFFCPSLRARSRQPVKRYKKLLADIFPRSQDGEPNDRMISKLCEYVSKNPVRIPNIATYLEQRCYKELRNGHLYLATVIPCIYRRLLCSCKEQMPLLAPSSLSIIRTLLDQTQQDDMRTLSCLLLVDFLRNQVDGAYMFNVEGIIPKLCELGRDVREDEMGLRLRSAALQALAFMVQFMGDYSHVSMNFDEIVSVTMDNYEALDLVYENGIQDTCSTPTQNHLIMDVSRNPAHWSRVCLQNMAKIAKEATTVRRVLDPLFRHFDRWDCWSPYSGLALSVLSDKQQLMEKSGQNSHLLLLITIKHLDHKNVTKQPGMQVNIIKIATQLAQKSKQQASVSIITAISDLVRHLRKSMHCVIESSEQPAEDDVSKSNFALHSALEECLVQLMEKVGDVGPVLDMLAVVLESIPPTAIIARATISSVFRTAKIAASVPNLSYHKKAFPEALFHQLLLSMLHPDHKTRVGSHRILSTLLAPSFSCPWAILEFPVPLEDYNPRATLLVALSAFSPSWIIGEKLGQNNFDSQKELKDIKNENGDCETKLSKFDASPNETCFVKPRDEDLRSMRLSSHQVGLLLSSIWTQAFSVDNTPVNYEAMAHSFSLALWFSQVKSSSHMALVRCFQLAFSLRSMSLDNEIILQLSRKRCLYTLANSMLIFSAKSSDLPHIVPHIKASMVEQLVDPHLSLMEDSRLHVVSPEASRNIAYGCEEDEEAASKFLAAINKDDDKKLREIVISHLMHKFENLPELVVLKEQLQQEFSPDDAFLLGAPLFMETPHPCSPYTQKETRYCEEDTIPSLIEDEDPIFDGRGSQSNEKMSVSINSSDVVSVNKLIESVLETARQVANQPVSTNPVPYDQVKNQCEALVMEKQHKMSVLLSFKHLQEGFSISSEEKLVVNGLGPLEPTNSNSESESKSKSISKESIYRCDSLSSDSEQSFRLPPSSPYDKFLKAAGW